MSSLFSTLSPALIRTSLALQDELDGAMGEQYHSPVCIGCGGEKESYSGSFYPLLCAGCRRKLPKEIREPLNKEVGRRYYECLAEALELLSQEE